MQYIFDISIATQYGVNVAIFLNNIAFWTKTNMANGHHFHDGRFWTYNSVKAFSELFPFWTQKQIRRIIDHCVSNGLLMKGKYNHIKYDQTTWYALTDEGLKLLNLFICPNGQINSAERANQIVQTGEPIPDVNTDIKTDRERDPPPKAALQKKKSVIAKDFAPNESHLALAAKLGITKESLDQELDKFIDYYDSEGSLKANWNAAFRNWLRKSIEFRSKNTQNNHVSGENFPPKETIAKELVRFQNTKEYNHPIVFLLYEKIGSWTVRQGTTYDIERLINTHYQEVCQEYRKNKELVQERINYYLKNNAFMTNVRD